MSDFSYFDVEKLMPYNAYMTFVISSRGAGKTYSNKKRILRKFNKTGEKFLFLKRTETELEATVDGFWDDIENEKIVFKYVKNRFYVGDRSIDKDEEGNDVEEITWRLFGYTAALSTTVKLKGISPQDVTTVLWDEFVAYDGRYLRDEATRLLDVMETVGRMRDDVRLIATGNKNEDGYYPVLHELGCSKTSDFEDNKIYRFKSGEILVYSFTNDAYIKAKSKTKLGKVARGTSYYEKMIDNVNQSNFSELILADRPKKLSPVFTIVTKGEYYNVYFMRISKSEPTGIYIESAAKLLPKIYTTDTSTPTIPRLAGNGFNMLYGFITAGMARFSGQVEAQRVVEAIISKRR
jgi:hypothetical protein